MKVVFSLLEKKSKPKQTEKVKKELASIKLAVEDQKLAKE